MNQCTDIGATWIESTFRIERSTVQRSIERVTEIREMPAPSATVAATRPFKRRLRAKSLLMRGEV